MGRLADCRDCGEAAAVVAHVDDEALLSVAAFVDMVLEFFELIPGHAGHVEIAQGVLG